ncbi:TPA: hypothetical protein ACU99A_005349 [Pseudomonas aeruginosa]
MTVTSHYAVMPSRVEFLQINAFHQALSTAIADKAFRFSVMAGNEASGSIEVQPDAAQLWGEALEAIASHGGALLLQFDRKWHRPKQPASWVYPQNGWYGC